MIVCGITDTGLHRRENQDRYAADVLPGGFTAAVVCDGMGGANAGSVASSLAVETYMAQLREGLHADMTDEQLRALIAACIAAANAVVFRRAAEDPACEGMGTTLVSALVRENGEAVIANVGDSRAYHLASEGITRVTRDHSVVEDLITQGRITEEEARCHPNRNLITRALGTDEQTACDVYGVSLAPGELLLLCSDGLVITLRSEEMLSCVRGGESLPSALKALIAGAREHGAPDNVTAVLIQNL